MDRCLFHPSATATETNPLPPTRKSRMGMDIYTYNYSFCLCVHYVNQFTNHTILSHVTWQPIMSTPHNKLGIRIRRILPCAENTIENNYCSPAALETSKYTQALPPRVHCSVNVFVYRMCVRCRELHPHRGNGHKEEMS